MSGGTDNHLMLVDLRNKGLTGKVAEQALDRAGITVNKNTVPRETQSPFVTSGIRIGTPAVTTRGMGEAEMERIAGLIDRVLTAPERRCRLRRSPPGSAGPHRRVSALPIASGCSSLGRGLFPLLRSAIMRRGVQGPPRGAGGASTPKAHRGGVLMAIRLGDVAPDFEADTTTGQVSFHEWKRGSWAILFAHPKDFTPVCTTELGRVAALKGEFDRRNTKLIGLSIDSVESHERWAVDVADVTGFEVNFPIIGDPDRRISTLYDMIHPNVSDTVTVRSVFVIGPDNRIKLTLTYPANTGLQLRRDPAHAGRAPADGGLRCRDAGGLAVRR